MPSGGQNGAGVVGTVGAVGIVPCELTRDRANDKRQTVSKALIIFLDFKLQTECLRTNFASI